MSKGQRGNKEAKKPRKAIVPVTPGGLAVPVLPLTAPPRPRHK